MDLIVFIGAVLLSRPCAFVNAGPDIPMIMENGSTNSGYK
jgi:hypothetical protein